MATHESHVRLATSETEAAVLRIDARDSLRTIEWPPRWPIDLGISLLEEGALEELPSGDPALSVFFETRTASRFSLHVIEHGGTAIELTVRPVAGQVEPRASARAIAANLRRLGPPRTTSRWQTHVGDLAFEVELPAGFATSHDEILDEGWAEDAAIYLGSPASELDFVEGESPPRRTADESVTLVLAEGTADALPLTFGAHRTGGGEAWLAPVPCRCRRRCTIEVHGEPAQRERLLAALAAAHVRRRVGTIEDVHVREAPADDARDVGRIWPSREVHVLRTVDGWAEIDGHDSTSSPGRPVRGWIPARALGPHC